MSRNVSISMPHQGTDERRASVAAEDVAHLANVKTVVLDDAAKATESERSMTLWQGIKTYPKAVGWSVLLSTCIVMEGFDLVLINSLYALPAFTKRFGTLQADGTHEITAAWQSGLSNGALVGEMIGLMTVGILAERYGFRKTLIGALVLVTLFVFLCFFAQNLTMLLIGEILCGLPWGAFQTITTTYAAEVCPVALRPYLTTYVNLCWVIGQFLSSGVLKGVENVTTPLGYKLPYGLQWIWPIPLIVGISLAPESPWWLVRQGRKEDAKRSLMRLTSRNQPGLDVDQTVNMIIYTTELERANTEGASYLDCFRGVNLRRTEIVAFVWAIQTLSGSAMIGYSTYFFEQAGLATSNAFSMSLAVYGLGAVGTISSWFLMGKFGRRTLYLVGLVAMFIILLIVGFLGIASSTNTGAQWAIGAMIVVYTFAYDATVGPVCYSLVAELSSTRLRNKTVVLSRNLYNIVSIISNILMPLMLNPDSWAWGGKTGFFWAGTCVLSLVWVYFRLPEPKGKTFAELDILFESKTSARKFATTDVSSLGASGSHAEQIGSEKNGLEKIESVTSDV